VGWVVEGDVCEDGDGGSGGVGDRDREDGFALFVDDFADELRNTWRILVAIRQAQKMAMTSNFPSLEWNESEEESMTSVKTFTDAVRKSSVSLENDIGQVTQVYMKIKK
jgi:hypothetical protein